MKHEGEFWVVAYEVRGFTEPGIDTEVFRDRALAETRLKRQQERWPTIPHFLARLERVEAE